MAQRVDRDIVGRAPGSFEGPLDPRDYWDAADLFERANGRLYLSADFALPRDLEPEAQIALAHAFAQELTADQRLPYTLAIHAGRSRRP